MQTRHFTLDFIPDLRQLLGGLRHGTHDPTIRVGRTTAMRAARTPEGPAGALMETDGRDVTVSAWGRGASWMLETAPQLLGASDDVAGFEPRDPVVARLNHRFPHLRIGRSGLVTETLIPTIIEQKVTGVSARRSYRALIARYGEDAPGPLGLRLQPEPSILASLPYYELHPLNVERRRAQTLTAACRHCAALERVASMNGPEADRRLRALPGLGVWTAAVVRSVALGDPDAVEVGDCHIPSRVAWALAGQARGSDQRMLELLEPYRGHRGRVVRLIEAAGLGPPRFGPRMYVADYAAM